MTAARCSPPDPNPTKLNEISWHTLPDHLGWESIHLTRLMKRRRRHLADAAKPGATVLEKCPGYEAAPIIEEALAAPARTQLVNARPTLPVSPDIALAILKANQAAAGRLWYLLRCLDKQGRGWLHLTNIRQLIADKNSDYHVCGRRQLRNLLQAGTPLFWQIEGDRLWLRRPARVAAHLGLEKVVYRPVAIPHTQFLGPLKQVKAYLYATLHSTRTPNSPHHKRAPTVGTPRPPND